MHQISNFAELSFDKVLGAVEVSDAILGVLQYSQGWNLAQWIQKIIKAISQPTTQYGSTRISQKEQLKTTEAEADADHCGGVLAQEQGASAIPTHIITSCDRWQLLIPMGTKLHQIFLLNGQCLFACLNSCYNYNHLNRGVSISILFSRGIVLFGWTLSSWMLLTYTSRREKETPPWSSSVAYSGWYYHSEKVPVSMIKY